MRRAVLWVVTALIASLTVLTWQAPATAAAPYKVTAKVAKRSLVMGEKVLITGTVRPAKAGDPVQLQVKFSQSGKWTLLKTARAKANGTFAVSDLPANTKTRWYRAVRPATKTRKAGASPAMVVEVYKWSYLTEREAHDDRGFWVETVDINGGTYPKSVTGGTNWDEPYIEYNLSRRCTRLRTVVGLSDKSTTGATAIVELLGDGNQLFTRSFGVGESQVLTLDVSRVLRLRLNHTRTSESGTYPYSSLGSPRVLCR